MKDNFTVNEPVELNRFNDSVVEKMLHMLYRKLKEDDIVMTGANASQTEGQDSYVELLGHTVQLNPYSPFIYLDKNFSTPKKYAAAELEWYKTQDLSIIGHPLIEGNQVWESCCSQDDKKLVNSNYGWCVFSEDNGSQYDNCLNVLTEDKTTRNAVIIYNRPSIYTDYKAKGAHDMLCTMYSHFVIRKNDGKDTLYMIHNMRSNDIKFGFITADLSWNCFVYQNMYEDLKKVYPSLQSGTIIWTSDSMHLYSRHYDILKQFVEGKSAYFDSMRNEVK